ncbi:MAG: hypothetical protein ACRDDF_03020 [Aeromonas sp.]
MIKNHGGGKLDALYTGPFTVVEVTEDHEQITINCKGKPRKENIKNVKPFWKCEDVMYMLKYTNMVKVKKAAEGFELADNKFPPNLPPVFPPQIFKGKNI